MIGYLHGEIIYKNSPYIIVDVNGVGYKVVCASDILTSTHLKDVVSIFIHTHVREDTLELYGFSSQESLHLFELLVSVNGIGPKTAIGVFTLGAREEIIAAIQKADVDFFTGVPRLGRKNAQKIIIELKNKIGSVAELDLENDGESDEVLGALVEFGFTKDEARKAIKQIGEKGTPEEKIKLALKYLGR